MRKATHLIKFVGGSRDEMNETKPSEPSAQGESLIPTPIYTHLYTPLSPSTCNKARVLNVARRYPAPAPDQGGTIATKEESWPSEAKHLEASR